MIIAFLSGFGRKAFLMALCFTTKQMEVYCMEIEPMGHGYKVIQGGNGKYQVVMIISEHDSEDEAVKAMLEAAKKESDEIMKREIEELRKQGINAVTFEDAIKDMKPEELERFLEERNRKFINPLVNKNIEMFEQKRRRLRIKRVK